MIGFRICRNLSSEPYQDEGLALYFDLCIMAPLSDGGDQLGEAFHQSRSSWDSVF